MMPSSNASSAPDVLNVDCLRDDVDPEDLNCLKSIVLEMYACTWLGVGRI